jgi:hypothetical protein
MSHFSYLKPGMIGIFVFYKSILVMKNCISTIFLIVTVTMAYGQASTQGGAFDWLKGTWEKVQTKPGQTAYEVWSEDVDGNLTGMGCTLNGADTVFIERLKIIEKSGDYYYVADVSHNAAPVLFKMTEIGDMSFISENPEHDFPKKITYRFDGTVLTATISAGQKEIPFRFRRKT